MSKLLKYHQKIEKKADLLLQKLIPEKNDWIHDILIIGAGSFPSERSLRKLLTSSNIHYTLVEPDKTATDFFCEHYTEKNFTIQNTDINTFLLNASQQFDLIYFEHPETMTLPLILGQLGIKKLKRVALFRESFANFTNILKENSLVIASCMSKHECDQLKNLLRYSIQLPVKTYANIKTIFYGGPYSGGLVGLYKKNNKTISAKSIRGSNRALCAFVLLGIFYYLFYASIHPDPNHALQRLGIVIIIGAQLYLHQPGMRGYLIMFLLFILQIAL